MDTSKQKLLQAQQLLKNKQYPQARQILETLPDHPTPRQWLAKLDQIAPVVDDDLFSQARPVNKRQTGTLPRESDF